MISTGLGIYSGFEAILDLSRVRPILGLNSRESSHP
jgi:hypothetical protein